MCIRDSRRHAREGEGLPQFAQLRDALLAQGLVGAAAHVDAAQISLRDAVPDEIQSVVFHDDAPFLLKIFTKISIFFWLKLTKEVLYFALSGFSGPKM